MLMKLFFIITIIIISILLGLNVRWLLSKKDKEIAIRWILVYVILLVYSIFNLISLN
jgi:Kef-type K+ transport system membrane component KefB